MGPVLLRKHYKNSGFCVVWHPKMYDILGVKCRVKMLIKVELKCWPCFCSFFRPLLGQHFNIQILLGSAGRRRCTKTWPKLGQQFNPTAYIYIYIYIPCPDVIFSSSDVIQKTWCQTHPAYMRYNMRLNNCRNSGMNVTKHETF